MILSQHTTQCLTLTGPQGDTGIPGGVEAQPQAGVAALSGLYSGHGRPEHKDTGSKGEGSTNAADSGAHAVLGSRRGPAQP